MTQIFNFSAGPAVLPKEVLQHAASEMLDWHGSGMSVMEMSHRGPEFISIYQQAEADLRELLAVPANYKILFMQGGGLGQNAVIPLNLLGRVREPATIDFVNVLNDAAALMLVRGADYLSVFEKPQRDALAMLFLRLHHQVVVAADVMVIPRSCSCSIQSMVAEPSWTSPIL